MEGDALWYEAAHVVGITNALNVVADGLAALPAGRPCSADSGSGRERPAGRPVRRDSRLLAAPTCRRCSACLASDPAYAADVWAATRRAFGDNLLTRRLKEALAFAVSLTSRSAFGTGFHLRRCAGSG